MYQEKGVEEAGVAAQMETMGIDDVTPLQEPETRIERDESETEGKTCHCRHPRICSMRRWRRFRCDCRCAEEISHEKRSTRHTGCKRKDEKHTGCSQMDDAHSGEQEHCDTGSTSRCRRHTHRHPDNLGLPPGQIAAMKKMFKRSGPWRSIMGQQHAGYMSSPWMSAMGASHGCDFLSNAPNMSSMHPGCPVGDQMGHKPCCAKGPENKDGAGEPDMTTGGSRHAASTFDSGVMGPNNPNCPGGRSGMFTMGPHGFPGSPAMTMMGHHPMMMGAHPMSMGPHPMRMGFGPFRKFMKLSAGRRMRSPYFPLINSGMHMMPGMGYDMGPGSHGPWAGGPPGPWAAWTGQGHSRMPPFWMKRGSASHRTPLPGESACESGEDSEEQAKADADETECSQDTSRMADDVTTDSDGDGADNTTETGMYEDSDAATSNEHATEDSNNDACGQTSDRGWHEMAGMMPPWMLAAMWWHRRGQCWQRRAGRCQRRHRRQGCTRRHSNRTTRVAEEGDKSEN